MEAPRAKTERALSVAHIRSPVSDGVYRDVARLREKLQGMGFNYIFAGSVAGVTSKLVLQPLDLVKTRMQVQDGRSKGEYKGLVDAFRTIVRGEGVVGLYRGMSANLVGSGVSWGAYYFLYNSSKRAWRDRGLPGVLHPGSDTQAPRLSAAAHLLCAGAAGATTVVLTNPIWMIKTRMQIQGREGLPASAQYRGLVHAVRSIVRDEGVLSLYRGMTPALLLVSNGALQFMAYEELRAFATQHVTGSEQQLHAGHFLAMGAISKMFSSTVTFPLAVTRSRLYQRRVVAVADPAVPAATTGAAAARSALAAAAAAGSTAATAVAGAGADISASAAARVRSEPVYAGFADAVRSIYTREGPRGFFRGLGPHLLKTGPASSINWAVFELVSRSIRVADDGSSGSSSGGSSGTQDGKQAAAAPARPAVPPPLPRVRAVERSSDLTAEAAATKADDGSE